MRADDTPNAPAVPPAAAVLLTRLAADGIAVAVHHHPAVFTVAESAGIKGELPGGHTKNLFLKDRKGRLLLVTAESATRVDLKGLGRHLGAAGGLSFGSPDLLRDVLGVEPGSVTPLAALADAAGRVEVVLDAALFRHALVNVHPLVNTMTVAMAPADLVRVLGGSGHPPRALAFGQNCVTDVPLPS